VLANPLRLRVLDAVRGSGPLFVSDVAARCGLTISHASQILRALESRGLLTSRRRGARVLYVLDPGGALPGHRPLAVALQRELAVAAADYRTIVWKLTAFTHPRRVAVVQAIARGTHARSGVGAAGRMSQTALQRNLSKLKRRGVLDESDGALHVLKPASPLAAALLSFALTTTA